MFKIKKKEDDKRPVATIKTILIGLVVGILLCGSPFAYSAYKDRQSVNDYSSGSPKTSGESAPQPTAASTEPASGSSTPKPKTSGAASSSSSYKAAVCVKTPIPYKTSYIVTSDGVGTVTISGGVEGYTTSCGLDSSGVKGVESSASPIDKRIYVGDGGGSLTVQQGQHDPYDVAYARATGACSQVLAKTNNDYTAYNLCVKGIMHYNGY